MDSASQDSADEYFDGHDWTGYRTYVKLVREHPQATEPYRVKGPGDIHRAFGSLSTCDRERFYAIHLDSQNQVCGVELVSQGTIDASLVAPREVYKAAILSNASGLILLHNHPSGCTRPSSEDKSLTRILRDGGKLLGIPVLDHVIRSAHANGPEIHLHGVMGPESQVLATLFGLSRFQDGAEGDRGFDGG